MMETVGVSGKSIASDKAMLESRAPITSEHVTIEYVCTVGHEEDRRATNATLSKFILLKDRKVKVFRNDCIAHIHGGIENLNGKRSWMASVR
ncbi:hypothetical protein PsorP6_003984 [Peronosclerospora sorghi]|uniref:Uncharacterized protein n=1 Tax=Peronosclerospora sorghi TaxID=230839 RepID=A0ACC0VIS7_9STRA|nr:hypothetical protein PsorP6_003984 [Peronosclerospora sorghi]